MKLFFNIEVMSVFLLCFYSTQSFPAKKTHTDHPLIAAYQGSTIHSKKSKEFDEYELFRGYDKQQKSYITETLEGKITQILYVNPAQRSTLEIYRNYRQALDQQGTDITFECNQGKNRQCMDQYVGASLRSTFNIHSIYNKSGRYLIANLDNAKYSAVLVIGVGDKYSDVHVIEKRAMETDKVSFNLDSMNSDLEKKGFVVLQGLYFDTNKTALKASSKDALEIISALLKQKSEVSFLVVGHTDSQGELGYNMDLSKGRAAVVKSTLQKDFRIKPSRLSAHGVGPLSPVASNKEAIGMAQNRRVVLVQR
ncbi:OmpA family protein [uncultured Paraglaciecola sp.]|uniref:OmpA family protein n=1 Tax=uncultured Paraglaciecola sp. TaxID=1765024 RepID=UPI002606BFBB|nr:OmpA family protein [uncultured Paraglaciecola sp.]